MDKISVIIPVKNEEKKSNYALRWSFLNPSKPCRVIMVDVHLRDKIVGNMFKKEVLS